MNLKERFKKYSYEKEDLSNSPIELDNKILDLNEKLKDIDIKFKVKDLEVVNLAVALDVVLVTVSSACLRLRTLRSR